MSIGTVQIHWAIKAKVYRLVNKVDLLKNDTEAGSSTHLTTPCYWARYGGCPALLHCSNLLQPFPSGIFFLKSRNLFFASFSSNFMSAIGDKLTYRVSNAFRESNSRLFISSCLTLPAIRPSLNGLYIRSPFRRILVMHLNLFSKAFYFGSIAQ